MKDLLIKTIKSLGWITFICVVIILPLGLANWILADGTIVIKAGNASFGELWFWIFLCIIAACIYGILMLFGALGFRMGWKKLQLKYLELDKKVKDMENGNQTRSQDQ